MSRKPFGGLDEEEEGKSLEEQALKTKTTRVKGKLSGLRANRA